MFRQSPERLPKPTKAMMNTRQRCQHQLKRWCVRGCRQQAARLESAIKQRRRFGRRKFRASLLGLSPLVRHTCRLIWGAPKTSWPGVCGGGGRWLQLTIFALQEGDTPVGGPFTKYHRRRRRRLGHVDYKTPVNGLGERNASGYRCRMPEVGSWGWQNQQPG